MGNTQQYITKVSKSFGQTKKQQQNASITFQQVRIWNWSNVSVIKSCWKGPSKLMPKLHCPECKAIHKRTTFNDPRGLGLHRSLNHGIKGTSKGAISYRAKLATKGETTHVEKEQANTTPTTSTEIVVSRRKIGRPKGTTNQPAKDAKTVNETAVLFLTVGRLTQLCADVARIHSTPEREFTESCARLFLASQIRA
jgi:hypothetical protein